MQAAIGDLVRKVAVIGAGQMGSGIAQVVAQSGTDVLLADVDIALAEKAKAKIGKSLGRLVEKEKIVAADAEAALSRITRSPIMPP
jgi:3-hydroxybutyryl-CoA dehydrogenase